ncbi:MAG TPA: hypothetical protein VMW57_04950 [Methyloceanibacter sp.]|nr:hypothetical protein [Methyloceanibacter sp.]
MQNTSTHVTTVCRPGAGAETCRFLAMDGYGWACARGNGDLEAYIEEQMKRALMTATGANCSGRKL